MKVGIVGNGGIVLNALDSLEDTDIKVSSLWCRNESKGKPIIETYHIDHFYTDYDLFLKDDSFDTVYIGLINSLHYEYAKLAILAHKHVIVEKPFTVTLQEALELQRLSKENHVYVFEAIMSRYNKNYENIREHLNDVGNIRIVNCNYSQYSRRYDAYKNGEVLPAFDPKLAGGALYDINVYNIHFVVGLFGKPNHITYNANSGFNGVDTSGVLVMVYDDFIVTCTGAKDSASHNGIMLQGDAGTIIMDNRPGIIQNVVLEKHDGSKESLDIVQVKNPMKDEFLKIQEVIDDNDETQMNIWLNQSIDVMSIIDAAIHQIH